MHGMYNKITKLFVVDFQLNEIRVIIRSNCASRCYISNLIIIKYHYYYYD